MDSEKLEKSNYQELKEKADASLEKAKELILEKIPKEEIVSIYVKGSYVQDELLESSDVDLVVILRSETCLPDVYDLSERFGDTTEPPFQVVSYTLNELQTGKKASNRTKEITPVSIFVKQIEDLPLLYGLKPEGVLHTRTDLKDLETLLDVFKGRFLPDFHEGKFKFKEILKQVIWLADREQRVLGYKPAYLWQKLAESIDDPKHIIHLALKLRRRDNVTEEEQEKFIEELDEYIEALEEKYSK